MNEWRNEGRKERATERKNERMNEWMNEWMKKKLINQLDVRKTRRVYAGPYPQTRLRRWGVFISIF